MARSATDHGMTVSDPPPEDLAESLTARSTIGIRYILIDIARTLPWIAANEKGCVAGPSAD
jgi:hypothetical protein